MTAGDDGMAGFQMAQTEAAAARCAEDAPVCSTANGGVSDSRRAEGVLVRSRNELQALYDAAPIIMCLLDGERTVLFANRAFQEFTRKSEEELIGKRAGGVFGCLNAIEDPRGCGHGSDCESCSLRVALADTFETGNEHRAVERTLTLLRDGREQEVTLLGATTRVRNAEAPRLLLCLQDVTERRQSEAALRESEQRYRSLVATSMDAVLLTIPDGRILSANDAACRMFGFSEEELLALGRSAVVDDTDPRLPAALEERARTGRLRCELTFKRKDGTKFPGEISSAFFSTQRGEPRTSMVIRDLTEQKRIEKRLRESEERYRAVVEDQTETISRFREDGTLIFVNEVYCRFFGKTAEEILGSKWQPMAVSEDLPYIEARLRTMSRANPVVMIENRVYSGSGQVHWMQFVNRGFFDAAGNLVDIQSVGRDISVHRLMETALRESEELYRELFDKGADALMVFDAETLEIEDANPKAQELYGYTRDELLLLTALELSAEPELSRASLSDVVAGKTRTVSLRNHKKKDGAVFPVEISAGMFSVGGRRKMIGAVRDVSERKWAEEALRTVSAYVRGLIEASVDALVAIGPDGKITDVNRSTEELTGFPRAELIGTDFSTYFTQPEQARAGYQRVFQEGRVQDYGLELRRCDGHITPVHYNASVYRDDAGQVVGVFAAARDMTERKRAEEALRESEQRYRSLVATSMDAVLLTIPDGRVLSANDAACRMFGFLKDELITLGRSAILDETDPRLAQALEERARSGRVRCELTFKRKDGTRFPGEFSSAIFATPQGEPRTSMVIQDISERKWAEEALRKVSAYVRGLIEASVDALVTIGPDGKITDVNRSTEELTGLSRAELIGTDFSTYFTQPEQARAGYQRVFQEGRVQDYGLELRHCDGHVTPVHYNASVYRDQAGQVAGAFAAARDISERKRAERILQEREQRFRSLFDNAPIALWEEDYTKVIREIRELRDSGVTDLRSYFDENPAEVWRLTARIDILGVNKAAARLHGAATPEELRSKIHRVFAPESYRALRDGIIAMAGGGALFETETVVQMLDGARRDVWVRWTGEPDNAVMGPRVYLSVMDITERKRTEAALEAKQEELHALASELAQAEEQERRRIAAYLHDEIGQLLAAIRVKFGAWKNRNPSINAPELLSDIERTIDQTINETRLLTYELSPPILFELGLGPALEWLGERVCEEHGIAFKFQDGGRTKSIPEELATALYRIARELLMNVVKHAQANRISVSVDLTAGAVQVRVEDDGIGMNASQYSGKDYRVRGRFGLLSIRERLGHFGGSLDFDSVPGRGTCAVVTAPLGAPVVSNKGNPP